MNERSSCRFDSIEEAHEYIGLLREVVEETQVLMLDETDEARHAGAERTVTALRLVSYKLEQLHHNLATSSRLLNDLRTLRRALNGERQDRAVVA